ncbi:MAG: hypothetical protein KDA45_01735 [Planctomycetales bacterium]|nr:hypothetical protein [Planctomycetales bacterium]
MAKNNGMPSSRGGWPNWQLPMVTRGDILRNDDQVVAIFPGACVHRSRLFGCGFCRDGTLSADPEAHIGSENITLDIPVNASENRKWRDLITVEVPLTLNSWSPVSMLSWQPPSV